MAHRHGNRTGCTGTRCRHPLCPEFRLRFCLGGGVDVRFLQYRSIRCHWNQYNENDCLSELVARKGWMRWRIILKNWLRTSHDGSAIRLRWSKKRGNWLAVGIRRVLSSQEKTLETTSLPQMEPSSLDGVGRLDGSLVLLPFVNPEFSVSFILMKILISSGSFVQQKQCSMRFVPRVAVSCWQMVTQASYGYSPGCPFPERVGPMVFRTNKGVAHNRRRVKARIREFPK